MADDKIDYIKQSLDGLHLKVDKLYSDIDTRLKTLEGEDQYDKGRMSGALGVASLVAGVVGSVVTMAAGYFFKK